MTPSLFFSPNKMAIIVTPLKLLQKDNVNGFRQFGIPSSAINHDILIPHMTKHYGMHHTQTTQDFEDSENVCIFTEATSINCPHQSSGGW
ncbi:hypothetical protein AZE42_08973 [Rhizopogon vesiculosus]|uniref:Uncharacterized protein n=1 Tax=Rhizopogon vesiculosus TaxID=180088 RepID=A0A1J8QIK7_9AGAM|nr:hypothetical protein AZE42_08973 [Rhizopogon vesiculosus]